VNKPRYCAKKDASRGDLPSKGNSEYNFCPAHHFFCTFFLHRTILRLDFGLARKISPICGGIKLGVGGINLRPGWYQFVEKGGIKLIP
jgi:hypothetical protein